MFTPASFCFILVLFFVILGWVTMSPRVKKNVEISPAQNTKPVEESKPRELTPEKSPICG
jgi:hypothetical protein